MNIFHASGNTPLIEIEPGIWGKLETYNPTGSVKDRIATYILHNALTSGLIKKNDTIIEATSGNTGIAFSWACSILGLHMIVVMPSNMSEQRKKMIQYFGGTLLEVGPSDFAGACQLRDKLVAEHGYFTPDQFNNPLNIECHFNTTGVEILRQIPDNVAIDAFVAGIGTGGTFVGAGKRLKSTFPQIHLVPVEPIESAILSGASVETLRPHGIQGIGDGFIPNIVDQSLIDEVGVVSTQDAINTTKELAFKGILCGISSGANYFVAKQLRQRGYQNIVTIICDRAERYSELL